MISRSLHVPGSPSSAFTTRYLGLEGGGEREGRYIKGEWEGEEIRKDVVHMYSTEKMEWAIM